ncbi:MAG: hypothetical protein KA792_02680 [Bacteroidales bacterium]|nr:hypothetical protein [Bacteroidales bacterium]
MIKIKIINSFLTVLLTVLLIFFSCQSGTNQKIISNQDDSIGVSKNDNVKTKENNSIIKDNTENIKSDEQQLNSNLKEKKSELPTVLVYNFHLTNRCPSCIAIEDATTKTLNLYFSNEMKQGRIKRQILNVDEDKNKMISQKYEAYGASIFITRIYKGKESTIDLTGAGFKFARNKEEKFIELLKDKIMEFLK